MHQDPSARLPDKIALVHEWFSPRSSGGAEKVVKSINDLLVDQGVTPDLAALVDGESHRTSSWLYSRKVHTSFIQHLPWGIKYVQRYLPLLPLAIEELDLSEYPLVISSSHLVAKGVLISPDQLHISYIHTPVRYAWDQMNIYLRNSKLTSLGLGPLIRWQLHQLRQWDQLSALRVNCLIANSRFTASRIKSYWGREAKVLHPPVQIDRFNWQNTREKFYLCLSRLVPNKRVDLVVSAFNKLQLPLIVVGDGPQRKSIQALAGPTVKLLGQQSNLKVQELMSTCRAFVYGGIEDFGIAPVEAMASGSPVIALGKGGLLDTVRCITKQVPTPTGLLFKDQNVESLVAAVSWFEDKKAWRKFDSESIRLWSENFSTKSFSDRFRKLLLEEWNSHMKARFRASHDPVEIMGFTY